MFARSQLRQPGLRYYRRTARPTGTMEHRAGNNRNDGTSGWLGLPNNLSPCEISLFLMDERTCEAAVTRVISVNFDACGSGDHGEGGRSRAVSGNGVNNQVPRPAATTP